MSNHNAVEAIREWCEFGEYRTYILMAIARSTHNDDLSSNSEISYRKVIHDEDDIERAYTDLLALVGGHDYLFRIYLTVNARNTLKAYFNFREEMDGWIRDIFYGDEHAAEKLSRVDSYWKSALHRPEARDDRYFLFDLDDISDLERDEFLVQIPTDVHTTVTTPNGYHVVTEPFNYTDWDPTVEYDDLDTDGQLFIDEIAGRVST
ncbi:hypothetical protein ACLI4Y_19520 [Natrialbaceae archaeon A-CW3]